MLLFYSSSKNQNEDILEGVAYHSSGMVCYNKGLIDFKNNKGVCSELTQGRFFIKYKENNKIVVRADEDGNELIFYYAKDDFWSLSTSFLGLLWFLKAKGRHLTASKLELAKFFVNTSLFEQPYNDNLPINEIKLLDAGSEVHIFDDKFDIVKSSFGIVPNKELFFERVNKFVENSRVIIGGISHDFDVDLELSGGIDSRIVMGLALPYKDSVKVSSDKNRVNDYLIAKNLASVYKIKLRENRYSNNGDKNFSEKWVLYKLANVGVSRTNPRPNSASGTTNSVTARLNGGGGENNKVFYNINSSAYYNLINKTPLNEGVKYQIIEDFSSVLTNLEYGVSPQRAMVDIYSKYRQRFFAGRAWYYSLFGLTYAPMSSRLFKEIIESPDIEEVFNLSRNEILERNLISLFVLYILDSGLPFFRFDDIKKDFSLVDIANVENISKKYNYKNDSPPMENRLYGEIKRDRVLPDWISLDTYSGCNGSFDDMFYKDIEGVFDVLEKLEILESNYIKELKYKVETKSLSLKEQLPLLHLNEIINASSTIDK